MYALYEVVLYVFLCIKIQRMEICKLTNKLNRFTNH